LAITENNCIIGACCCREKLWWSGDEIYIDEFFISPQKQRSGFGKELMDAVLQYAKCNNIKCITLLTDHTKPAYEFYHKLGFNDLDHQIFMYKNL
jgi:ribosomal protein S18 acetylase RimI-like enzyme